LQRVESSYAFEKLAAISNTSTKVVELEGYTLNAPEHPLEESIIYLALKRLADIIISGAAIIILMPLMLIVAILIWLEDRGPIIYYTTRVGQCGKGFRFYKFRSMYINADDYKFKGDLHRHNEGKGGIFKIKLDPRVTRVGRWIRRLSIDELPQLFLVFSGRMSMVGPRPQGPEEVQSFTPMHSSKLLVKPGLLCLREIRGRSELTFEQWISADIEYVMRRSLWLDITIFVMAFPAVLSTRGAY